MARAAETARQVFEQGAAGDDLPALDRTRAELEAGIALYRAAVETGLAHEEPQPRPRLLLGTTNLVAHGGHVLTARRRGGRARDARGGAVLAEGRAELTSPLPRRDARTRARDRCRNEVVAFRGRMAQGLESRRRFGLVSSRAPGADGIDGLLLHVRSDVLDRRVDIGQQWVGLAGDVGVDADHHVVTGLKPTSALGEGGHQSRLHVAGLDRLDSTTHL